MTKELLATTKNGINIYVGEETYAHMAAHSAVKWEHVKEAIEMMDYKAPFTMQEINLNKVVGKDNCIIPTEEQKWYVIHATRKGRNHPSNVILNTIAEPADTTLICIGICTDDDGKDTLFTAFYGKLAPKEPEDCRDEEERMISEKFWSEHCLVCSEEELELVKELRMALENVKKTGNKTQVGETNYYVAIATYDKETPFNLIEMEYQKTDEYVLIKKINEMVQKEVYDMPTYIKIEYVITRMMKYIK